MECLVLPYKGMRARQKVPDLTVVGGNVSKPSSDASVLKCQLPVGRIAKGRGAAGKFD